MAKKKTSVYSGSEMHLQCSVQFTRTRLEDRTIVSCPACKWYHVSIDIEKDEDELEEKKEKNEK